MFDSVKNFFSKRSLATYEARVGEVSALEDEMKSLSTEALAAETEKFKERLKNGETTEDILPRAFAVAREAAHRTLGQRPYDVQIMGGAVIHEGAVAEMMTGEGKTLTAVAPVYFKCADGERRPRGDRERISCAPRRRLDGAGLQIARTYGRMHRTGRSFYV